MIILGIWRREEVNDLERDKRSCKGKIGDQSLEQSAN